MVKTCYKGCYFHNYSSKDHAREHRVQEQRHSTYVYCIYHKGGTTEQWVNDGFPLNDAASIGYPHGEK